MSAERRGSSREKLTFEALCQARGYTCAVQLSEISNSGCRAQLGLRRTGVGERIVLALNDYVSLPATVKWARFGQAGLAFANPLHGAILVQFARQKPRTPA